MTLGCTKLGSGWHPSRAAVSLTNSKHNNAWWWRSICIMITMLGGPNAGGWTQIGLFIYWPVRVRGSGRRKTTTTTMKENRCRTDSMWRKAKRISRGPRTYLLLLAIFQTTKCSNHVTPFSFYSISIVHFVYLFICNAFFVDSGFPPLCCCTNVLIVLLTRCTST